MKDKQQTAVVCGQIKYSLWFGVTCMKPLKQPSIETIKRCNRRHLTVMSPYLLSDKKKNYKPTVFQLCDTVIMMALTSRNATLLSLLTVGPVDLNVIGGSQDVLKATLSLKDSNIHVHHSPHKSKVKLCSNRHNNVCLVVNDITFRLHVKLLRGRT